MPIPSNDYDVGQAFKRIEKELIASMMKNMKRHTDWETDEGFQWEMWQALQLQALEKYRKENPEKFKGEFEEINKMIPEAIKAAREHGQMDQEIEILEAIRKGWKPPALDEGLSGAFFRLNDRKLNALIEATTGDFEKAEAAILRKANDNYRKIIFNAQMYANTGAATYEKAVDMATKDFLAAGINCIEYKNGSRHKLDDYCDMALRTAQKRAYLAGEGEKRQEWGIHTVIMNKRGEGQPCPLCLPFVGKIMIDDVYGGGSKKDGPYKLLSEAMAAGLYHPRCRDSHTAYFPDIDEEEKLTREEVKKTKEDYMVEEEANYCARQEEKYGRLAAFSLDPENQRKYAARRDAWGEKAEQLQIETEKKPNEPTITAEMQETVDSALEYYVSGDGMYINKWLRDPEGFRKAGGRWTDHDSEFLAAMDVGTQDVVTEKVLYRSVDASAVFGDMTVAEWEEMTDYLLYGEAAVPKEKASAIRKRLDVKGKEITEPGFMSTTKDRELAMDWEDFTGSEKPIVLELDVPEGIRGKDMAKFEIEGDEQFEVLLARGQRYEVTDVRVEEGTVVVKAELKEKVTEARTAEVPTAKQSEVQEVQNSASVTEQTLSKTKEDALARLEGKEGEYASRLRMTIRNTEAKPMVVEGKIFWYDKDKDDFFFNPDSQNLNDYDLVEVISHENAHRLDELIYHSENNQKLTTAIANSKSIVMDHLAEIEKWFEKSGPYEDSMSVADMLCAITDGEIYGKIPLPYGHKPAYWADPGRKQREVFANMSNLLLIENVDPSDLEGLITEVFDAWREMIK